MSDWNLTRDAVPAKRVQEIKTDTTPSELEYSPRDKGQETDQIDRATQAATIIADGLRGEYVDVQFEGRVSREPESGDFLTVTVAVVDPPEDQSEQAQADSLKPEEA